jgi:transposase-like protein
MKLGIPHCPTCGVLSENGEPFYIKKGYYTTKWNRLPVPRYKCNACGVLFSSHTFLETYRQKKPHLNQQVFKWYASATTQRRMAKVLQINRKTVVRKFLFMAELARAEHERRVSMGKLKTSFVQFDEVETFEHTKLKPLSVTVAVRAKTGEIIEAQVGTMQCKGHLAEIAQTKYGPRDDTRDAARIEVLKKIRACSRDRLTIASDELPVYGSMVKALVPHADHQAFKAAKADPMSGNRRNVKDRLFAVNLVAAKFRHDLSRMARRTWVTTKLLKRLQAHLDLYIAYNNGYKLAG